MLDKPQVLRTTAQPAAVIRLTVPRSEIQNVMGPSIGELMSVLAAQGITPTGPIFAHHLKMDSATFDFELGVPIGTPVAPSGHVVAGELPSATVARTVYHGPYDGLHTAWGEFDAWVRAEGHEPAQDLWECYVSGPESSPDPANWRTELNRPLSAVAA